jgi:5-methylcytosine-specific restriction endonuclease McrA
MNFKHIDDQELLSSLKSTVECEKAQTHKVLLYLREVEVRKLHLEKGYSSLFVFCTEYLNYSEPEAQIRIQAMRLLRSVPIVEEKIKSGVMSLSVAASVQSHFRKEDLRRKEEGLKTLTFNDKLKVVEKVQTLSVRESQKALAIEFPEVVQNKDSIKPLTNDKSKMEFVANSSLAEKLKTLQNKLAHKNPNNSLGELIEILADMALEKLESNFKKHEPLKAKRSKSDPNRNPSHKDNAALPHGAHKVEPKNKLTSFSPQPKPQERQHFSQSAQNIRKISILKKNQSHRQYIPKNIKAHVWTKSNSRCCYIDKATHKQCSSQYALEIDHIMPLALGGSNEPRNLRLLCRAHNQFLAVY